MFLIVGMAAKTLLILAFPLIRWPEIGTIVIMWDPLAVAFGAECFVVGLAVRWLASLPHSQRGEIHLTADGRKCGAGQFDVKATNALHACRASNHRQ